MKNTTKILKNISAISFAIFIITTYFGIVGFKNPWKSVTWINIISFAIFLVTLIPYYILSFVNEYSEKVEKEEKSKMSIIFEYLTPLLVIIAVFLWTKFISKLAPIYGEHIIYNPFYLLGFGNKFHGNSINIKNNNSNSNVSSHILITKLYSYILTMISGIIYMFSYNYHELTNGVKMIWSMITKTIVKIFLGYVPANDKLKNQDNWFVQFMQYRIASTSLLSKAAALVRRVTLIGLDMPELDKIFNTIEYNNVIPTRNVKEFNERKENFIKLLNAGNVSYIDKWIWETLPYIYHWIFLSLIGYILGMIVIISSSIK